MVRARLGVLVVLVSAALVGLSPGPARATLTHPYLLFNGTDVPGLQTRVRSGQPMVAYDMLIKKADAFVSPTYADNSTGGDFWTENGNQNKMATVLADLAFAYKLTGNTAYADRAMFWMNSLAAAHWPHWNNNELGAGDLAKGVALAFDWLYDYMSPTEISTIVSSLVAEFPVMGDSHYYDLPAGSPSGTRTDYSKLFNCLDTDYPAGYGNWYGVCGGGTGLLLLAIKDEAGVPASSVNALLQVAYGRVADLIKNLYGNGNTTNTATGSDPSHGGEYAEGVLYQSYGAHNAFEFGFAWTHMGLTGASVGSAAAMADPLNEPGTEGLEEAPVMLAMEQQPGMGFTFIPRNDSMDRPWFQVETLPMWFKIRPDGVSAWLWDHTVGPDGDNYYGKAPVVYADDREWGGDPTPTASEVPVILYYKTPTELPRTDPATVAGIGKARHYTEFGLVDMRTGFAGGTDEVAVTFEARQRFRGGHTQYDVGSFTIYGYGGAFAIDSGYGHLAGTATSGCKPQQAIQTGCGEPDDPQAFSSARSIGHNVMQTPDPTKFNGLDQGTFTQSGMLLNPSVTTIPYFRDLPNLDYLRSNLTQAYGGGGAPRATRNLLFTRVPGEPVFVAVSDGLQRHATTPRLYEWRLNTDPQNGVASANQKFAATAASGAVMTGAATALDNRAVLVQRTQQGGMGTGAQNSLSFRSVDPLGTARVSIDHLALMALTKPGVTPPTVGALGAAGGNLIQATWSGGTVYVSSRGPTPGLVGYGDFRSDGFMSKISLDQGESVLDEGTVVSAGGRDYIKITGTGAAATVLVSGNTVTVTGSTAGNTYTVYSPQTISQITINGTLFSGTISHTGNTWSFTH